MELTYFYQYELCGQEIWKILTTNFLYIIKNNKNKIDILINK
jgi:hypothetical protein